MRKIPIEYAKEGDILGKNLYNNLGSMLIREGVSLNFNIIKKLKKMGFLSIYIKDRYNDEIIEEIIKPKTMTRIHELQENLKNIIIDFNNSGKADAKKVDKNVGDINERINEVLYEVIFKIGRASCRERV